MCLWCQRTSVANIAAKPGSTHNCFVIPVSNRRLNEPVSCSLSTESLTRNVTGVESVGPTPMEMAKSLLSRRIMLKDALPGIIRNLQAEEESILPKLKRSVDRHQKSNNAVSELKLKRDALQKEAALILKDVKSLRTKIDESGGMIRLDPNWARRLEEKLIDIETRIETQALDHKAERKLISINLPY